MYVCMYYCMCGQAMAEVRDCMENPFVGSCMNELLGQGAADHLYSIVVIVYVFMHVCMCCLYYVHCLPTV